jgi:hypothetical protein
MPLNRRKGIMRSAAVLLIFCFTPIHSSLPETSLIILDKMFVAVSSLRTLRYSLVAYERVKNKSLTANSIIKLQVAPRKVYLKNIKKGLEVLWVQGKNNGNAWVNPNAFPYITLNLDPEGDLMSKSQHHTIHQLGFSYFSQVINRTIQSIGKVAYKDINHLGDVEWDGKLCYKLFFDFSEYYKMTSYTIAKNDDIAAISSKLHLSKFIIRDNNPSVKIRAGETLSLPSIYASKIILYIDKKSNLPLYLKVIDNDGLYESYEFYDVKANEPIADEEFTTGYTDYHF